MLMNQTSQITNVIKETLENIEGAIKHRQSRETCNIGYTGRRKAKQTYNIICVRNHLMLARHGKILDFFFFLTT
jgi:hypothetical protein